jgi:hypothetical protein
LSQLVLRNGNMMGDNGGFDAGDGGNGGTGGSGVVIVSETNSKTNAPGVWTLADAFAYTKAGLWGG